MSILAKIEEANWSYFFTFYIPTIWNAWPDVCSASFVASFRMKHKPCLFTEAIPRQFMTLPVFLW